MPAMKTAEVLTDSHPTVESTSRNPIPPNSLDNATIQATKHVLASQPIISVRESRVNALQDRWERLQRVINERAVEMDGEIAGGGTGLLVRDYKGKNADRAVYKVDTGLLDELRQHERQAAEELGQLQTKGTGDNRTVVVVLPGAALPAGPAARQIDDGRDVVDISLIP
jgi:hypothetical protein